MALRRHPALVQQVAELLVLLLREVEHVGPVDRAELDRMDVVLEQDVDLLVRVGSRSRRRRHSRRSWGRSVCGWRGGRVGGPGHCRSARSGGPRRSAGGREALTGLILPANRPVAERPSPGAVRGGAPAYGVGFGGPAADRGTPGPPRQDPGRTRTHSGATAVDVLALDPPDLLARPLRRLLDGHGGRPEALLRRGHPLRPAEGRRCDPRPGRRTGLVAPVERRHADRRDLRDGAARHRRLRPLRRGPPVPPAPCPAARAWRR